MAADFNKPVISDTYTDVLLRVREMFASLGTMDGAGSNPPTNLIRWNSGGSKFEKWGGASWADLAATYAITVTNSTQLGSVAAATYARKDQGNEFTGEVQSSPPNGFRLTYGSYGVMLRNDGSDFYLLVTASGDKYGSWNSLRPFQFNLATGAVTINGGLPWTSGNFDPTTKANLTGAAFTGTVSATFVRIKQSQGNWFDFGAGATGPTDNDCYIYNRNNGAIWFGTNDTLRGKMRADGVLEWASEIRSYGSLSSLWFSNRSGTARDYAWYANGNVIRLYNSGTGDIVQISESGVITASDFTSTSDGSLKEQVRPLRARGRLRPIRFRWALSAKLPVEKCGSDDIGFRAQDIEPDYPECVFTDADGIKRVSYPKLVAVLAAESARDRLRFWIAIGGAYALALAAILSRA